MDQGLVLARIFVAKLLPNSDKNSHLNFCSESTLFPLKR